MLSEVESTGAHHQFYEKFNIRQQISIIFKHLWTVPAHHQAFLSQTRCVILSRPVALLWLACLAPDR